MRLFIALDLPQAIKDELARTQARLRRSGDSLRWVDPAGIHLTLQFLGEAPAATADQLLAALASLSAPPIRLHLAGLGAFPNSGRPRVVWAGIGGDSAALGELQRATLALTTPLGFAADERPFAAHLTLARARQDARPAQVRAFGEALSQAAPPAPLHWEAGRPLLFQSSLSAGGPIYTRLGP